MSIRTYLITAAVLTLSCEIGVCRTVYVNVHPSFARLREIVSLAGRVEPLESYPVAARWGSFVKKVFVASGQRVKKGDPLIEMDGQKFEADSSFLRDQIAVWENQKTYINSDLDLLQQMQKRRRLLASKEIISGNENDNLELKILNARLRAAQTEKRLNQANQAYKENEEKLSQLLYTAPVDGVVTELAVDPRLSQGYSFVSEHAVLVRIDRPGKYLMKAEALDTQAVNLRAGQEAQILLNDNSTSASAVIVSVALSPRKTADALHLFEVVLAFESPGSLIARGLSGRTEIPIGSQESVLALPWSAIKNTKDGSFVTVVDPGGLGRLEKVTLGVRGTHFVGIVNGVSEKDNVQAALW